MRKWTGLVCVFTAWALSTGCEWTTGGGTDSFSGALNWVNFSGVYRNQDGGLLVSDFTATTGTDGTTENAGNEKLGEGNDVNDVYAGVTDNRPIIAGTITITAASSAFTDVDGNGILDSNSAGETGTIDYETGAWTIDLAGNLASGQDILATYSYTIAGTQANGPGPGSSGFSIFTFTIHQAGNRVTFTDNNGAVFEGNLGSVRSTGGVDADDNSQAVSDGETVIAQFTVSGNSAAGVPVTITGTLEGAVDEEDGSFSFVQRRISGTWIEEGTGVTGDIIGVAGPVGLVVTDSGDGA